MFGVAEEHVPVVAEEKWVLESSVACGHGTFEDDQAFGVPDFKDGYACGGGGIFGGGGIDGVVGADDEDDVGFDEVVVDLVRFRGRCRRAPWLWRGGRSCGLGVGLRRSGTESDVDALGAQFRGEVGDGVLGLGYGHAVAGGDDDCCCAGDEFIGGVGLDLVVFAVAHVGAGGASMPKPPAMMEMNDRFMALHMMSDR